MSLFEKSMILEEIKVKLKLALKPKRFMHSVNVMNSAVELAGKYGADKDEAALAGLLHDCARDFTEEELLCCCRQYGIIPDDVLKLQPMLLHGRVGAFLARDLYRVDSPEVLEAIGRHTLGSSGMDLLSCIVFLADYIEPSRNFPGVEAIREEAFKDLKKAMLIGIDGTICSILANGCLLHPDTVSTRNWLIKERSMVI